MNKIAKGVVIIGGGVVAGVIFASLTTKPESYTFDLSLGANYISMPMIPEDATPTAIFGPEVNVWGYDIGTGGWETVSAVVEAKGYYAYAPKAKSVTITGTKSAVGLSDLIYIYDHLTGTSSYEGFLYALVGPGTKSINVSGSILESKMLAYIKGTNEFEYTNILEPMNGYWMEKSVTV